MSSCCADRDSSLKQEHMLSPAEIQLLMTTADSSYASGSGRWIDLKAAAADTFQYPARKFVDQYYRPMATVVSRSFDLLIVAFLLSHIPITVFIDSQASRFLCGLSLGQLSAAFPSRC